MILTAAYLLPAIGLIGLGTFFVFAASGWLASLIILIGLGLAFAGTLFLAAYLARSHAGIVATRVLVLIAGLAVLYYHSRTSMPWALIEWTAAGLLLLSLLWFGLRGWNRAGFALGLLCLVVFHASWAIGNRDKPDLLAFLYLHGYPGLLWLYAAFVGPWFVGRAARAPPAPSPRMEPGQVSFDK